MITEWKPISLAGVLAAFLGLLCNGCSGINRSIDVSPATFILPGLVQEENASSMPQSFVAEELEIKVAQGK